MTMTEAESAMNKLKKTVYTHRIRLMEFFRDYDKLRTGYIFANHFLSALNMAGLQRFLSAAELELLGEHYSRDRAPSLRQVDYRSFVADVDRIFTLPALERHPLEEVPREPADLLDKDRFRRSIRLLESDMAESTLDQVLQLITDTMRQRGVLIKPFFDDAARSRNSSCRVGHVTERQFRQVLDTHLALGLTEREVDMIVEKFVNEDFPEMVNYRAFVATIDPTDPVYNPYE